jgi:glycine dehydrogenase subunit 2
VETLDEFCEAMLAIARESAEDAQQLKDAPHSRPVSRPDEALAAKRLVVRHEFDPE